MPKFNVSNVFECGRNNPDVSYDRAYMATSGNEYFTYIIDHLKEYHDRCGQKFPVKSSKKLCSAPWNKKKNKSNVTSIILHAILHFILPSL